MVQPIELEFMEEITSQSQSQTPQETVAIHKQSQNVGSKDFLIMKKL